MPETAPITPDLHTRVAAELNDVYDDVPYMRPSVSEVIRGALTDAATEMHGDAAVREGCTKVDDCTAEAIVLRAVADWISELAKGVGR